MKKITIILVVAFMIVFPAFSAKSSGGKLPSSDSSSKKNSKPITTPEQQTKPVSTPVVSTELTTLSAPVYRVELYDTKTITQQDLDEAVSYYSSQLGYQVGEDEVLKDLIDNTLFAQALDKALSDGTIDIYNGDFNDYVSYQLQTLAGQYGFVLKSETDAENFLKQFGTDYNSFAANCLTQWAQEQYIEKYSNGRLSSVEDPTEAEIKAFLDANRNLFVGDEYVKVAHIFFSTAEDRDKAKAEKTVKDIQKKIKSGKLSFEKACVEYSEDTISAENGGVLEYWIGKSDKDMVKAFGEDALNTMFSLGVGDISGVETGPQGYHIFKCVARKNASLLGLDDLYNPNAEYTVRYIIEQQLKAAKYQEVYLQVYEDIIEGLRKQAKLKSLK